MSLSILLALSEKTLQICKPLFNSTPVKGFTYTRHFRDDTIYFLTTTPEWIEYSYKNNLTKFKWHLNKELDYYESEFTIWDNAKFKTTEIKDIIENKFDLHHGMTIIDRFANHCDLFTFSADKIDSDINKLYYEHQMLFRHFINYFKDQARGLIKFADKHKFKLEIEKANEEKVKLDINLDNVMPINRYYINDTYLTCKEVECIKWSELGKTTEEIAIILDNSVNTIKSHLKNIKRKLGLTKIIEIVRLLKMHGILV